MPGLLTQEQRAYAVSQVAVELKQLMEQRQRTGRKLAWPEIERINRDSGWVITLASEASPRVLFGHHLSTDDLRHAWGMAHDL